MEEEVKISELPVATDVNDDDLVMIVQDGFNKQVTKENFQKDKVNKSGDILTGPLVFENKSVYEALRKKRTLGGEDYSATFGLGGNLSARLEILDPNNNIKGSIEARADGYVWNGKTDRRLVERVRQTWGSSMNFTMEAGQHALVMISNTDCLMLWMGGNAGSESISAVRLYGTAAQATSSGTTVTVKFSDNRNFTGNAIIS